MQFEAASEFLALLLSSAGLTGSLFAVVLSYLFKKAKLDAKRRRDERMRLEVLRLDGEEKLSELLFMLLRYSRGLCTENELLESERAYSEHLEESRRLKNEIIGMHTSK